MPLSQTLKVTEPTALTVNPERYKAAWIDEQGREIPISEEMILHACELLENEGYSFFPCADTIRKNKTPLCHRSTGQD